MKSKWGSTHFYTFVGKNPFICLTVVVVVVCVERESIGFLIYYLYCEAEALARSTRVLSSVSFFVVMCSTFQGRLNGNYDHPRLSENQEKYTSTSLLHPNSSYGSCVLQEFFPLGFSGLCNQTRNNVAELSPKTNRQVLVLNNRFSKHKTQTSN